MRKRALCITVLDLNDRGAKMAEQKRDYYEVLGVDKNADDAAIKKAYRLHLIVFETFLGAAVHRLFAVEQVRRRIPYITHIVNTELISGVALGNQNMTFVGRFTQFHEAYAGVFQNQIGRAHV